MPLFNGVSMAPPPERHQDDTRKDIFQEVFQKRGIATNLNFSA
jgi:hypothetical protein